MRFRFSVIHSNLKLQPTKVAINDSEEARLLFWNEDLVAVVSRLGPLHQDLEGFWFIEAVFGLETKGSVIFPSLDAVATFIVTLCANEQRNEPRDIANVPPDGRFG